MPIRLTEEQWAFYRDELSAQAVPIDQMEYAADEPAPTLLLPPGEFRIRIVDEKAATVDEYSTE